MHGAVWLQLGSLMLLHALDGLFDFQLVLLLGLLDDARDFYLLQVTFLRTQIISVQLDDQSNVLAADRALWLRWHLGLGTLRSLCLSRLLNSLHLILLFDAQLYAFAILERELLNEHFDTLVAESVLARAQIAKQLLFFLGVVELFLEWLQANHARVLLLAH